MTSSALRTRILALRVIQQMLGDRRTLALIVVVPVILLSFMGILIRHDPSKLAIGVVNESQPIELAGKPRNLGDQIVGQLASLGDFTVTEYSADEAKSRLDDGTLEAVITLPPDFAQTVLQDHTLTLDVEFEGSNPMIADRLRKLLERAALQAANFASSLPVQGETPMTASIDATYLHGGPQYDTLDYMAPALIGFFVFFFVFLLTCISFLRERVAGTLERLQATPIRAHEIILGYMVGFLVFGLLQGAITLLFTVFVLQVHYAGSLAAIFVVETLLVALSVNLGIFLSTFAQNEFQVLQFMPLIVVSQGLLGGVIWQIDDMPSWLQVVSRVMPLTYANQALRGVMITGSSLADVWSELLILLAFAAGVVVLASRTAGRIKM